MVVGTEFIKKKLKHVSQKQKNGRVKKNVECKLCHKNVDKGEEVQ